MSLIRWGAAEPPRPFSPNATVHPATVAAVAAVPAPTVDAFGTTDNNVTIVMVLA